MHTQNNMMVTERKVTKTPGDRGTKTAALTLLRVTWEETSQMRDPCLAWPVEWSLNCYYREAPGAPAAPAAPG